MRKILGISGKMCNGKDSLANFIFNELAGRTNIPIYKTSFANPIKAILEIMFPQIDPYCFYGPSELRKKKIEGYVNPQTGDDLSIRDALTQIGKWGRDCNKDFWVSAIVNKFPQNEDRIIIVTDCRFSNEIEALRKFNAKIIRVIRPDITITSNDCSETDLDNYTDFDKVIINDTLDNLRKEAISIIKEYIL